MLIASASALAAGLLVLFLPLIRTVGPSGELEYASSIETEGVRAVLRHLSPAVVSVLAVPLRRWRSARLLATLPVLYYAILGSAFLAGVFFIPAAVLQVIAAFLPYQPEDHRPQPAP
jgi:hypothetical protein